ncbi:MAG: Ig-like domain-containing protein [Eubacterium sp.]|nr:Ig-like domain-containing protein [Eubacterium sp.]
MRKKKKHLQIAALVLVTALGMQPAASINRADAVCSHDQGSLSGHEDISLSYAAATATPMGEVIPLSPDATPSPTPMGEVIPLPPDETAVPTASPDVPIDPEAVLLSSMGLSLRPGKEETLGVSGVITGDSVDILWSSSDMNVATVTPNGVVRGENPGNAVITVKVLQFGLEVKTMTCIVSVTAKKASFSKLKKKMVSVRGKKMLLTNQGSSQSTLTYFGFFYKAWRLHPENYTYGSGDETIILYPEIIGKKDGSSSKLLLGIKLSSFVEIKNRVSRSFRKLKFAGGGESFTVSGSTSCSHKTIGSYIRWQVRTNGTFYLSSNKNTRLTRIDKLLRILSAKKPKIIVRDTVDGKKYKCVISKDSAKGLKKVIKKYRKLLRVYW